MSRLTRHRSRVTYVVNLDTRQLLMMSQDIGDTLIPYLGFGRGLQTPRVWQSTAGLGISSRMSSPVVAWDADVAERSI